MLRRKVGCAALAIGLLLVVIGGSAPAPGQTVDDLHALHVEVVDLRKQGRHGEATSVAERALQLAERLHGPDHLDVARSLNDLALTHYEQGRYADAEPLSQRALIITEKALGPDHPHVGIKLNNLASLYQAQGRYADADPLFGRALIITENALGPGHADVGIRLDNLASLYQAQGRYADAEPLSRRALIITEKALGPDHPDLGIRLNNLASLYQAQGRYADAEPLFQRALIITERALGADHPDVGTRLDNLASLYLMQGRYTDAEPLSRRALIITENALGPDHADVGIRLDNLASLYLMQGRYTDAEPLFQRALIITEKALGADHPDVGIRLKGLASLHLIRGRYADAEPLFRRALFIAEKAVGPDHPDVGTGLMGLAVLCYAQGRHSDAEPLFQRALMIAEKTRGPDHPDVVTILDSLASLYREQDRHADAEPLLKRGLIIAERALGPDHLLVGTQLNSLAMLYYAQGRYADAEPLYQRALIVTERVLGADHPLIGTQLNNLAMLYYAQGRYSEAEPLFQRDLAMTEKALGSHHPNIARTLNNLALLSYVQSDWTQATAFWRRSTAVIIQRARRGANDLGQALAGGQTNEAERLSWQFWRLVKAAHHPAQEGRATGIGLEREMFEIAQWALASDAAGALAQMAARGAKGNPALGGLIRERQDLVAEWRQRDQARNTAVTQMPDRRDRMAEAANMARLAAIDGRIAEIDNVLVRDFPEYVAFASPTPLSVEEVQAQLGAHEALVLVLVTPELAPLPEESFLWVVTQADSRWVRSERGKRSLEREVAALRCGLDATAWDRSAAVKCAGLLGISPDKAPADGDPLPFDHVRAHKLYKTLFGEVQDLVAGKHLLVVPSGPLTQLPWHVMVTAPPASSDHRTVAWLARSHALTVLPAVSSLKALRRVARPSAATKPMIGFANPLLDGPDGRYTPSAQLARSYQGCREPTRQRVASLSEGRGGIAPVATHSGLADAAVVRAQAPLPETADEVCAVARSLKADVREMRLGARATEREVRELNETGELARYRVLHFATHGTLAGQLTGTTEPGLILTPPVTATPEDDGYLAASEIASLKLDADWVILSACNTAAGDATGTEALSGLVRAFFYAQARALLVSHWAVDSLATVKLITSAVSALAHDKSIGRAGALRRAMLALIDKGASHEAHPAIWAPFVLVGEGADPAPQ